MQWPSTSRGHLCGASGEPKAKPGALLFATMLPSDRPGNPEPFSPPLAKYRSAEKARRLRKGDEGRRAMLHIAGDLNESNKRLANQRKAMLHILADYEEDRRRLASQRSEEHTSELQSPCNLVCRLLLEKKKNK